MATKNTILGTVPKSRGRYTEGDTTTKWYYDNILEYKGSSFRCISKASTGITGAPATYNSGTHTLVPNAGWEFFVDTTGALDVEERLTENEKKLSELENEVTNLVGRKGQDFSDTPKTDNSYWKDDGTGKAVADASGMGLKRVDAIPLIGIEEIYLSTNVGTSSAKQAYFVNNGYDIITEITSGGTLQVPSGAKFLLCNLMTDMPFVCKVEGTKGIVAEFREDVDNLMYTISGNTEKINEIDDNISIIKDKDYSNNEVKQGEIWTGNIGSIIASTTSSYSNNVRMLNPIKVNEGERINVTSGINGNAYKFIYTDANGIIIDILPNNYPVVSTLIVPNGAKYLYINYGVNYQFLVIKKSELVETIENIDSPFEKYYAACGDSITNANHSGIETIPDNDKYCPFDGTSSNSVTYKRKNYAYFIAKKNRLKWANYGWGGSPIIGSTLGGVDLHGFAKDRYLNIANKDWNYISIFFGWNDDYLGPMVAREQWLKRKYGSNVLFPYNHNTNSVDTSLIGTGNYCTQSQYNSMLTATGEVGGVQYDDTNEYFYALFIGTIDSIDVNTWYGAWNVVLKHFILTYPYAKIMPIVAYNRGSNGEGTTEKQKEAVRLISKKWGLTYYDFDSNSHQLFMTTNNTPIDGYTNLSAYRMSKLTVDSLHPSQKGYEYMYPSINNKLMSI